ncbi:Atypical chemokine receptor 4 [Merluccius polli]|uniref:Atypical chemokine receptor 4 n=1 Tax=Merluccius polli TaxID=89951 RepID=A0AA47MCY4_MERPO|nr:Atypical chemokine receptor 4 [Merluccius polli]
MGEDYYQDYHGDHNGSYDYDYDYHSVCDKESVRSFAAVFLPLVYGLTLVLGLAGNSLVVAVYSGRGGKDLRTLTDVCLLNLAASDLLLLLTLPLWAAAAATQGWNLGAGLCKLTSFLYSATFSCGMFLLACISVDRYLAVFQHAAGRRCVAGRKARVLVSAGAWAAACVLGLPELLFSRVAQASHGLACVSLPPHGMPRSAKICLELLEVALRFLLPLGIMGVCYGRVWRALSRAAGVRRDRKWRALHVLLAVVVVFLLTQLPYNVVKLTRALDATYALVTDCEVSKGLDHAMQVTESLALSHTCINPLLYVFVGSTFRGSVLRVAKNLGERLGGRRGRAQPEPAVAMTLRAADQTHSLSGSDEEDTTTFTI